MVLGGTTGLPLMKKKKPEEEQGMSIMPDKSKLPPQLGGDPTPALPWEKPASTGGGGVQRTFDPEPPKGGIQTNVTFNPDKSVTLSTGEKSFLMSEKEYRDYLRNQRRGGTNQPGSFGYERDAQLAANSLLRNRMFQNQVNEILASQNATMPLTNPESVPEYESPSNSLNLLENVQVGGGVIGGATAGAGLGAGIGSIVPVVGTAAGGIAGGIIGGLAGGASAYFYKLSSQRKQETKVAYTDFLGASSNMQKLMNSVNTGQISPMQAKLYWDNELQRVNNSERKLKEESKGKYGEELSKSRDELIKVETWKRRLPEMEYYFNLAIDNPDPSKIYTDFSENNVETTEE